LAHATLGAALEKKGDRPGALEEYRAAYALDSKNAQFKQACDRLSQPSPPVAEATPTHISGKQRDWLVLKIKTEAPELDKRWLLESLGSHGADHKLKFESVGHDFDYRIVFATGQRAVNIFSSGSGGSINASMAAADVYDAQGKELFKFDRKGRGTDQGATNAVAKEIVKRLLEWRSISH
jgi:hypothetical protein